MDSPNPLAGFSIVRSHFSCHDPLAWCGNTKVERQGRRNSVLEPQSSEAGNRKHEGIESTIVELAKPRVHVAADRRENGIWQDGGELCRSSDAARSDRWSGAEQRECWGQTGVRQEFDQCLTRV